MKKLQKGIAILAVSVFMMSMASSTLVVKQDKQDICYELGVWAVNNMQADLGTTFSPETQHEIHGIIYDNCMN